MTQLASIPAAQGPRRLVKLLTGLGPTFVKIGQYLALRPDLIPQEYCDELLTLVDKGEPFPIADVRRIIELELGEPVSDLFERFERRPIGVGSLSQVHRARLADGADVAVKVQRPGIAQSVDRDIRRLRLLARLVKRAGVELPVSARDLVEELAGWLRQEIDFTHELENARKLRSLAAGSEAQSIPRVYPDLSSSRVLTYEYLEGVRVSSVLAELRDAGVGAPRPLLSPDQRRGFATRLVTATLTQIFRYRFFHADVHPGNLLALPDERVGFIDFGLCDTLDETVRANQLKYLTAVYARDQTRMFRALTDVLVARPDSDLEGLRRDFNAETRSGGVHEHGGVSDTANSMIGIVRAARRNHYEIPGHVLSMYRALITVETLASELGLPNALQDVGRRFFADLRQQEKLDEVFDRDKLQQALFNSLSLARDAPGQLAQILADAAEGSVRLRVEVSDSARALQAQNRRARLWATAILSVSVAVLLAIPHLPSVFGVPLAWPLGLALGGLYLTCAALWRRL